MRIAVFPGSFDPFTNGHYDILERASHLFDRIILAVGQNSRKQTFFSLDQRLDHLQRIARVFSNVETAMFDGLLIDFLAERGITTIIRGLRVFSDYEYEFQTALAMKQLDDRIETIFLLPRPEHIHISSSIVKEIGRLGGEIKAIIPPCLYDEVTSRLRSLRQQKSPQ